MVAATKQQTFLAEHRPMPATEYHAHPAHGSSMLETFRESRRLFHATYVAKTMPVRVASPAMEFGTMVHTLLFEPSKFAETVADPFPEVAPDGKKWLRREGSAHAQWWAEEVEKRAGKICCDQETLDRVANVVLAIKQNQYAAKALAQDGKTEYSVFWRDKETGLECKCRFDFFAAVTLDLKTTADADPRAYVRTIQRFGYHRKWAHYKAGLNAINGRQTPFVHIAAESDGFFRVGCFELDDRDKNGFALGVAQRRRTLYELAECYESDDWREPWEKEIVKLELPASAFYEDQFNC